MKGMVTVKSNGQNSVAICRFSKDEKTWNNPKVFNGSLIDVILDSIDWRDRMCKITTATKADFRFDNIHTKA